MAPTQDLLSILAAVAGGNWPSWGPLLDAVQDLDALATEELTRFRRCKRPGHPEASYLESQLCAAGVLRREDCPYHQAAVAFHAAAAAVDLDQVPVLTTERHIDHRRQASLTRNLFRRLGLRGASITAPLRALCVQIEIPHRYDDHDASRECVRRVEAILLRAFPGMDDRSDPMRDYYDFCWVVR
jgi:hypothetical protein